LYHLFSWPVPTSANRETLMNGNCMWTWDFAHKLQLWLPIFQTGAAESSWLWVFLFLLSLTVCGSPSPSVSVTPDVPIPLFSTVLLSSCLHVSDCVFVNCILAVAVHCIVMTYCMLPLTVLHAQQPGLEDPRCGHGVPLPAQWCQCCRHGDPELSPVPVYCSGDWSGQVKCIVAYALLLVTLK
jgi:hypothetical protein